MLGLKSFRSAAIALAGVELAHRIRNGQHLLSLEHGGRASQECEKGIRCQKLRFGRVEVSAYNLARVSDEIFIEIYLGGAREHRPRVCDWNRNFRLHLLAPLRSRGKDSSH